MKAADIGAFIAVLAAGYMIGRDNTNGDFPSTDLLFIAALIGVGYYLGVVKS